MKDGARVKIEVCRVAFGFDRPMNFIIPQSIPKFKRGSHGFEGIMMADIVLKRWRIVNTGGTNCSEECLNCHWDTGNATYF